MSVLVTAIVLVVAFGRTGKDYFVDYARSPEMRAAFNANLAAVGRFIGASPVWNADRANVYVTDDYRDNFGTIAYFLYPRLPPAERPGWFDERTIGTMFRPSETIPLPVAPSLYVVAPDDRAAVTALGRSVRQVTPILDGGQIVAQAILADVSPPDPASPGSPVHAQLGRWLELESAQVAPGLVALRWRVLARPTYQPSIFVHLEDAAGHTLDTSDQVIGFPIAAWRIGQEFVSQHRLQAPAGTPPGSYSISAGVYDKTTGQRETALINGGVGRVEVGQVALAAPVPGVPTVQHPDARPVAAGLDLLGYDVPNAGAEAGAVVPLALVWQARDSRRPDDQVTVALRAADGTTLAQWRGAPGGSAFPTSRWAAGTIVRQLLDLPVPATFQGIATLDVSGDGAGGPGAPAELTRLTVKGTAHVFDPPNPRRSLDASFAGVGALVGADPPEGALAAGGTVKLTLYWRAAGASPTSYTVFVHLLDAASHVAGQRDEPPAHGTRPTTGWVAGEFVADPHEFAIDPSAAAGTYQVEVGLYDPQTGTRVATGTPDNRIVIAQLQVR